MPFIRRDQRGVGVERGRPSRRGCRAASATARRARPARRRRAPRRASTVAVTRSGSRSAGQVVGVDAPCRGSPRRPLGPAGPDASRRGRRRRAPWRTPCPRTRRRAPRRAAHLGHPPRRRRSAMPCGRRGRRRDHSGGGSPPRISASMSRSRSMIASVICVERRARSARRRPTGDRSTGGPAMTRHRRARAQADLAGARVEDPLRRPTSTTGITGAPVASASRAAPVLPRIGHRSGSRVVVPSG